MNLKELEASYKKITQYIEQKKLNSAFTILEVLLKEARNGEFTEEFYRHRNTYNSMLAYTFQQVEDPQKEKVYHNLCKQVITLTDKVRDNLIYQKVLLMPAALHKRLTLQTAELNEDNVQEMIETLEFSKELKSLLSETGSTTQSSEEPEMVRKIFAILWTTNQYKHSHQELIRQLNDSDMLPWYHKSVFVSAVTLSLLRSFDETKILALFDIYDRKEHQVWERALAGIVFALNYYNNRLHLYPELMEKLNSYAGDRDLEESIQDIIIQFMKSRETEKITRKFQDEIMPEMMKMRDRFNTKLDLDNLFQEGFDEDKNPEWERFFKDSPNLADKLAEFSNMQIEGSDVFMGTFAMLKQFPFFHDLVHWFTPFYRENNEARAGFEQTQETFDADKFLEGLQKTAYICNSDKYSFCINIKHVPAEQRETMLRLFSMEMEAMDEIAADKKLLNSRAESKVVFTQYIQDLYRFFKLHPQKNEFFDLFRLKFDLHNTLFFKKIIQNNDLVRNIAEFYFSRDYYKEALEIFEYLNNKDSEDAELWQKIGYAYEQLGQYEHALTYYQKAEYLNNNRLWLTKKLAFCNRRLKRYEKALKYYQKIEKEDPENLSVQANIGRTFLELGDYENALKHYYKVEFLDSGNHKILRPIAWCSFLVGKHEKALDYLRRIPENERNEHDWMNLGHANWMLSYKEPAVNSYRKSIQKANEGFKWFIQEFLKDSDYLIKFGIDPLDVHLMADYLSVKQQA